MSGHTRDIYSVAVDADSGVVLSAGRDGLLKIWAVDSSSEEQEAIGQLNCGTGIEGLVACGANHVLTAKTSGIVEQWNWGRGLFNKAAVAGKSAGGCMVVRGSKGAAARVVQPEVFSRDTKLTCIDASPSWVVAGSVDGSIDVWASCPTSSPAAEPEPEPEPEV